MKHEVQITPEDKDEMHVIQRMAELREYALSETDMDEKDVSSAFMLFAVGVFDETDGTRKTDESYPSCPECGEPIEDVKAKELGADPTVEPCGHQVTWKSLPDEVVQDILED